MSRPVIAAIAASVIAALTAVAYVVTTSSLESRVRSDLKRRVVNAQDLLLRNSDLEGLGLLKRAEALSRDPRFVLSLTAEGAPNARIAEEAFELFSKTLAIGQPKPILLSLTDKNGRVVALLNGDRPVSSPIVDTYLTSDGKIEYPALRLALSDKRYLIADVWVYENLGPKKVTTVPVLDPAADEVVGAIVIAYALTESAERESKLLGAQIAYFFDNTIIATSFDEGRVDVSSKHLQGLLFSSGMAKQALTNKSRVAELVNVEVNGEEYIATAGRLTRFQSKSLPADYPAAKAGAMVAMSVDRALAPLAPVKLAIFLVGLGAIVVALFAMFLAVKRILIPLDRIEIGVAEVLNGNLDYTFEPAGSDLDGLANGLNVLLARLLGRPEPGDEEFDEDGNLVRNSTSMQISMSSLSPKDAEALKLAQEPEDQYYSRLHREYKEALEAAGESTAGLSMESFVNKLRLSEATLKEKYDSAGVRFKVVSDDGKVSLKPVPIV